MTVGRSAVALLAALSVAAAAGCGGAKTGRDLRRRPVASDPAPTPPAGRARAAAGRPRPADRAGRRSRRAASSTTGSKALRRGDIKTAAHYFALPSKFQNATPVLTVNTEQERIAVNMSLSCGAVATEMGGAGAYTIVKFRLTERPGGDCGTRRGRRRRAARSASSGA